MQTRSKVLTTRDRKTLSSLSAQPQHAEETWPKREFGCNRATEQRFSPPLSQPSPLKNFVLSVNNSTAISWSCFYDISQIGELILNFTFNNQWGGFFGILFIFDTIVLTSCYKFLLSFFLPLSFFLLSLFFFNFFLSFFLPVKDYHSVSGVFKVRPDLHDCRRPSRCACTCDCRGTGPGLVRAAKKWG